MSKVEVRLGGATRDGSRRQRWIITSLIVLVVVGGATYLAIRETRRAEERLVMDLHSRDPARIWELIRGGLNVHYRRADGGTLLMVAAEIGDPEMIREVLRRGGRLEDRDPLGSTALAWATHPEAIRTLVKAGARIDVANEFGFTALIGTAQTGELEAVRTLLELGADPAAKTTDGETALDRAKKAGRWNVVRFFHQKGIRR